MKTKIALLITSLLLITALPGWAVPKLPVDYGDLTRLYGAADPPAGVQPSGVNPMYVGTKFHVDGIDITINDSPDLGVRFIHYVRATSFAEMEIESLLKPLSPTEDWVQKDDKTWVLPKAHAEADWDGEGKLTVTALGN